MRGPRRPRPPGANSARPAACPSPGGEPLHHAALGVDHGPRLGGRGSPREVRRAGPQPFAHLAERARRGGAAEGGPIGRRPLLGGDHGELPGAVPGQRLGVEHPVLGVLAAAHRAGQLVDAVVGPQLTALHHAAERHPGGALAHAEQPAPAHEPRARQPRRVHAEQQAGDQRPGRQRTLEQPPPPTVPSGRGALRCCDICRVQCNMARVATTMLPEPELLATPVGRRADPRQRPGRARPARAAPPHPVVPQRRRRRVDLAADGGRARPRRLARAVDVAARPASCSAAPTPSSPPSCTRPPIACCSATGALNDWVGRWLLGYPSFASTDAYRRVHMAHHRQEFGPDEPDLPLYVGYPITEGLAAPQAGP